MQKYRSMTDFMYCFYKYIVASTSSFFPKECFSKIQKLQKKLQKRNIIKIIKNYTMRNKTKTS